MPEYVKGNYIGKHNRKNYTVIPFDDAEHLVGMTPATLNEYNEYIKNK